MIRKLKSDETDLSKQEAFNAADWVALIDSDAAPLADARRFEEWYKAQEGNAAEFLAHHKMWDAVGNLANDPEARAILRRPRPHKLVSKRHAVLGVVAAAAAAAAVIFALNFVQFDKELKYDTARGEQLNVTLEDGSRISLNTDTHLSVVFTQNERRVHVDDGQTFVQVAKDAARPFRVVVRNTEVRALGTAFDVNANDKSVLVTMAEGTAAIYLTGDTPNPLNISAGSALSGSAPVAVISSGQQLTATFGAPVKVTAIDARAAGAWRENRIVFDRTPLGDAVQDVNRYRATQIVIDNPEVAALPITGVYRIDRLDTFVGSIVETFPGLTQHRRNNTIVLDLE